VLAANDASATELIAACICSGRRRLYAILCLTDGLIGPSSSWFRAVDQSQIDVKVARPID